MGDRDWRRQQIGRSGPAPGQAKTPRRATDGFIAACLKPFGIIRRTCNNVYGLYSGSNFYLGVRIVLYTSLTTFFGLAVIAAVLILTLLVAQISPPLETLAGLLLGGVNNAIRGSSAAFNPGLVTAACYLAVDQSCVGIVQDDAALRSLGLNV